MQRKPFHRWGHLILRGCTTVLVLLLSAHSAVGSAVDASEADTMAWRNARVTEVAGPDGWLGIVGLYWLREGVTVFGSGSAAAFRLRHPDLDPVVGSFTLSRGVVSFKALGRRPVTRDGKEVGVAKLISDAAGEPTVLAIGSLRLHVIERGGRYGIRLRETDESRQPPFGGLDYFSFDPTWILRARFERYVPVRTVPIVNVLGMDVPMRSPGALVFVRDGIEWRLDALQEQGDTQTLFVMFSDGTSGRETYGGGRFLSVPMPEQATATVDFNRAYNPPCAFTDFATCPLPPPQNRLSLPVTAGERRYARPGH